MRTLAAILLTTAGLCLASHGSAAEPATVPASTAGAPVDPARLESARRLVAIILPPEQRDAMFEMAVNSMMNNMMGGVVEGQPGLQEVLAESPELKRSFADFIDRQRKLAIEDIRETMPELMMAYASAYARLFTVAELNEIAAFLSTPTGTKYARQSMQVLADPDFAAWQRNVAAKGQARLKTEIDLLMQDVIPLIEAKEAQHHGS